MSDELKVQTRAALQTPEGRAFVWWLLEEAGIFRTTFVSGSPDQTAFAEGRRSLGLQLLARVERDAPGSTNLMRQEATDVPVADPSELAALTRGRGRAVNRGRRADDAVGTDYAPRTDPEPDDVDGSGDAPGTGGETGSGDA